MAAKMVDSNTALQDKVKSEEDLFDLVEPVEILSKLDREFYDKCDSNVWLERKAALMILEGLTSNSRFASGDYSEVIRLLKRMIAKDTNITVVTSAARCLNRLALGLKKKFAPYAASCLAIIVEKFKEKKPLVLAVMQEASDTLFALTTLEQIQDSVVEALGNKNPAMKAETSLLLARGFAKTTLKSLNDKKLMKPYFAALVSNLNESDPAVRESSAEALGVASKAIGDKPLQTYLDELDPIKRQKVKEYADAAVMVEEKCGEILKPATKPVPASAKPKGIGQGSAPTQSNFSPAKSRNVALNNGAATRTASSTVVNHRKKTGNVVTHFKDPDAVKSPVIRRFSEQKLEQPMTPSASPGLDSMMSRVDISSEITPALLDRMSDKNWKFREESLDKVSGIIAKAKNILPNLGELPGVLAARLQDSNRNIAACAFLLCQNLAVALGPSGKNHFRFLLPSMLSGLSDGKANVRSTVVACLNTWADQVGADKFFQGDYIAEALKGTSPYIRIELFNWLNAKLPTLKHINKEELNACLLPLFASLEDRNADVRKSAQDVVFPFMLHLGYDSMTRVASHLKTASKGMVQSNLDKARPKLPPKSPTTTLKPKAQPQVTRKSTVKVTNKKTMTPLNRSTPNQVKIEDEEQKKNEKNSEKPTSGKLTHKLGKSVSEIISVEGVDVVEYNGVDKPSASPVIKSAVSRVIRPLPPARYSSDTSQPAIQSIDQVVSELGSSNFVKLLAAIAQVDPLIADPAVATVMITRADHILLMMTAQLQRLLPTLVHMPTQPESNIDQTSRTYSGIVRLLGVYYRGEILPKQSTLDILRDLLLQLILLIVDPNISSLNDSTSIVRQINVLIVRMIEKSDPNSTILALLRLMSDARLLTSKPLVLGLTLKCQWKLLKQLAVWVKLPNYPFDYKGYVLEFHHFLICHPLSSFTRESETTLKTVKTIIRDLVLNLDKESFALAIAEMPQLKLSDAVKYIKKIIIRDTVKKQTATEEEVEASLDSNENESLNNNELGECEDRFVEAHAMREQAAKVNRKKNLGAYTVRINKSQGRADFEDGTPSSTDLPPTTDKVGGGL